MRRALLAFFAVVLVGGSLMACGHPDRTDSKGGHGERIAGKVVGVSDGDTITVLEGRRQVKVRLHGIDAPESHQDFGDKAKRFVSRAVHGKMVMVDVVDTDRYGRAVGIVHEPSVGNLNEAIAKEGLAWWYQEYAPNDKTLAAIQEYNIANQRGIWSHPNPIPPWEFRKGTQQANAPPAVTAPRTDSTATATDDVTVYRTKTGKKYHREGCRHLSKSSFPISLSDAKRVYGPCSVCRPPQ